jgi:hypothetical protein
MDRCRCRCGCLRGCRPYASGFFRSNQTLAADLLAAVEDDRAPINSGHNARAALEMIQTV